MTCDGTGRSALTLTKRSCLFRLTIGLSVSLGLFAIELIGFFGGMSMFMPTQGLICILCKKRQTHVTQTNQSGASEGATLPCQCCKCGEGILSTSTGSARNNDQQKRGDVQKSSSRALCVLDHLAIIDTFLDLL